MLQHCYWTSFPGMKSILFIITFVLVTSFQCGWFYACSQLTKFLSSYYRIGRVGPLTSIWKIYNGECIVRKLLEWNTEVGLYYPWENLSNQSPVPRSYGDRTLSRLSHHIFGYLDINRSPVTRLKPKIKLLKFEKNV